MLSGPNCSELVGKDLRVELGEKVRIGARNDALRRRHLRGYGTAVVYTSTGHFATKYHALRKLSTHFGATLSPTASTTQHRRLRYANSAIVTRKMAFAHRPRETTGSKSSPSATSHPAFFDANGPTSRKNETYAWPRL